MEWLLEWKESMLIRPQSGMGAQLREDQPSSGETRLRT